MRKYLALLVTAVLLAMNPSELRAQMPAHTMPATQQHGHLSVQGRHIVNQAGTPISLAGPSLFWSNSDWGQTGFYNARAVQSFARDWNADVIRVALGGEGDGSFIDDPHGNMARAETVIQAAINNGIYVIVDFHSHKAEQNVPEAEAMFRYIATKYGASPNLIYEIYNEPLDTTDWDTVVKPYADYMVSVIRSIDPDNIILVGTQTWSQDLEKAVRNPVRGHRNIAYTLHFYAGSHKDSLRNRAQAAVDAGLPIFVSEWGMVNYDGDGAVDVQSSEAWLEFMRRNKISHAIWAASNKNEGASMFTKSAPKTGPWADHHLRPAGRYARDIIRGWN